MDIRKLQRAIVDGLEDVKAQDIVVLNTEHLSALFERVIIASGSSNRQTKALASSVRESVRNSGQLVLRTEGEDNGEWIIVDCGAAVAHIMQPSIREYYHLEEIWGGKPVRMKVGAVRPGLVKASEPAPAPAAPAKARKAGAAKSVAAKTVSHWQRAKPEPASRTAPRTASKSAPVGGAPRRAAASKAAAAPASKAPMKKLVVNAPVKARAKPGAKPAARKTAPRTAAAKPSARLVAKSAAKPVAKAPARKAAAKTPVRKTASRG